MLGLLICAESASATESVTLNDKREIMADNAALLAEIETLNQTLASERAETQKIIMGYDSAISADASVIDQYKRMNLTLKEIINAKDKQVRTEKREKLLFSLVGLAVGIAIGH